mgnify:CR=1 FL=1
MPAEESLKLSVIDILWPGHFPDLVHQIDRLGYHRYWATEHHSPRQSASPTIVAALAAGLSKRLRIGTAAVLLNYRSPLQVAEDFRLLELLFPGRIDLGLSSAFANKELHPLLLDGRPAPTSNAFEMRAEELVRLVRGTPSANGGIDGSAVGPAGASTVPEVWVCGTSERSATLAGKLGAAYAFHDYLNQGRVDGPSVIETYLSSFSPTLAMPQPKFNIACYGICAETEIEARELWKARHGAAPFAPDPGFMGDPEQCRTQLLRTQQRYNACEIVIQSLIDDHSKRVASYRLLADVFDLNNS